MRVEIDRLSGYERSSVGPFGVLQRRKARKSQEDLRSRLPAAEEWKKVTDAIVDEIVLRDLGSELRHPYHPSMMRRMDSLSMMVSETASAATLVATISRTVDQPPRIHPGPSGVRIKGGRVEVRRILVSDLPEEVRGNLTIESVRRTIEWRIREAERVALSDEMLYERLAGPTGPLVIQHVASGLRAIFSPASVGNTGGDRFGIVLAKPDRIDSIDPGRPGVQVDRRSFTGLGIGEKIYRRAATILPDERWIDQTESPGSWRLRRKMHAIDPYRWRLQSCEWCESRAIDWNHAEQSDFYEHPRADGSHE